MQQFAGSCDDYQWQQFNRCWCTVQAVNVAVFPELCQSWQYWQISEIWSSPMRRGATFKSQGTKYNSPKDSCTHTHTRTYALHHFWVLFLLMGRRRTWVSWCGVIEAAVLKGCVPLLLLRHKVTRTPSQLLTQEVPTALHSNERGQWIFYFVVFCLDVALLTPMKLKQCSDVPVGSLIRPNTPK